MSLNRRLRLERSQYASDIGGGNRRDVTRVQRGEMNSKSALADPDAGDVLVGGRRLGEIVVNRLAEFERARSLGRRPPRRFAVMEGSIPSASLRRASSASWRALARETKG